MLKISLAICSKKLNKLSSLVELLKLKIANYEALAYPCVESFDSYFASYYE